MMKFRIIVCLFVINGILYAQSTSIFEITGYNLMKTVNHLCSDEFTGRLPGHEGYNKAAAFIAGEFKELGLKEIDGSYYQKLYVEYNQIHSPVKFNLLSENEVIKEYKNGADFVCRGFSGSGDVKAEIVFCGYGVDEEFYSDYKGVDVKDKIVMIFKPNPAWSVEGKSWSNGYPRAKSNIAARHGAAGLIMVSLPEGSGRQGVVASVLHGDGKQEENLPQIHIELDAADEILKNSGYTLSELQKKIDSEKTPQSFSTKTKAELYVKAEYHQEAATMNVWGLLEGTDPEFKDEYIIIGAHLDHVGMHGDVVYPGANDNASGSAAVLEIARAMVLNNIKPKRSVIFVLFTSEEQGLFGAKHMADNLPVPVENITAMLNIDCIAYGDSIQIGNGQSAPRLWNIIRELDKAGDNYMVENTWRGGGADAGPFHDKGIPAAYFVSTNSYENIHTIKDNPESLNQELMEKITRLAYETLIKVAGGSYEREEI
jgi:hypothetical protein